jgi:hypothetical protein
MKGTRATIHRAAALMLVVITLAACHEYLVEPPIEAELSGVVKGVTGVTDVPNAVARFLVEHSDAAEQWVVHVNAETSVLLRGVGGRFRPAELADIREGGTVHLWTAGSDLRSASNGQVVATVIVVDR